MIQTITSKILALDVSPSVDGLANVVIAVHWEVTANDGTYTSTFGGSTSLGTPDANTFIPYDQLTPNVVNEWITDLCAREDIRRSLELDLKDQATRDVPVEHLPPPWS